MRVIHGLENWKPAGSPVVTVGSFDGVHLAHRSIIGLLNHYADMIGGESLLVTFEPHPRQVLQSQDSYLNRFRLLTTPQEKIALLEKTKLGNVLFLRFDEGFSRMPYSEFIEKVLVGGIGVKKMVVGFNHSFGHDREGGFDAMTGYARRYGFEVERFPEQLVHHQHLSSTRIRVLLQQGLVEEANALLGYDYSLHGRWSPEGFSVDDPWKLIPGTGNYLVRLKCCKEYNFSVCRIQDGIAFPDMARPSSAVDVIVDFIKHLQLVDKEGAQGSGSE